MSQSSFFACGAMLFALFTATGTAAQNTVPSTIEEKLTEAAEAERERLQFDGARFSGPAWNTLVSEGNKAHFFMIGEEHGIAENPKLAAALFTELAGSGYSKLLIEVSPPTSMALDKAATGGLDGLRQLFSGIGGEPAFFGMKEEAELLVTVREAIADDQAAFWGLDYEVLADPQMLKTLSAKHKPAAALSAMASLQAASEAAWAKYQETRNPQFVFSFSADPALVRAVKEAWPDRDPETEIILTTMEETLEINRLFVTGRSWQSNARRGALLRNNFIRYWQEEKHAGRSPKVMAKFGANHMVRGRNTTETWDLGALLPETAALEGSTAFSLLVLPGTGAQTAVFDPTRLKYVSAPAKDGYGKNLEAITSAAFGDAFTLIDLRPIRPLVGSARSGVHPDLMRIIHGFDMLLVMSGSTPSGELDHPDPLEAK